MITVFDNFLDENLLNEIKNDPTFFEKTGDYKWWQGWFNQTDDVPLTLKHKIIESIWGSNNPIRESFNISGFEYWTGIQTADPKLGHKDILAEHYDKDEALFEKTGEIASPVIGTVFYPGIEDFTGGELAIYTDGVDEKPEIIKAKPNRLIIFNAGQHVHEVLPVKTGTRHAFAINLWQSIPYALEVGKMTVEPVVKTMKMKKVGKLSPSGKSVILDKK